MSTWNMLPKDLLVGRESELAILQDLYQMSFDCLQQEIAVASNAKKQGNNMKTKGARTTPATPNKNNITNNKQQQPSQLPSSPEQTPPVSTAPTRSEDSRSGNTALERDDCSSTSTSSSGSDDSTPATAANAAPHSSCNGNADNNPAAITGTLFCYLQGKPGVGKTALVQKFQTLLGVKCFFSYKFNQFGTTTPMAAVIQTLSRLAHQTVTCPAYSNPNLRQKFFKTLRACDTIRSLIDVVPAYGKMLQQVQQGTGSTTGGGDILKPIPQGLVGDVQKTLYPAILTLLVETRKFIQAPIVLFLDDIQWIDPGSKGVLTYLLKNHVPLLILVAFRDFSSKESTFTLDSILGKNVATGINGCNGGDYNNQQATAASIVDKDGSVIKKNHVVGLTLQEFTENHVSQLLSHLGLPDDDHEILSKFLFQQTEGNQFYLRFRLSVMAETGALMYMSTGGDVSKCCWKLDTQLLNVGMEMHSEDAVEYCVRVMQDLDRSIVAVLARIAVMPQGRTMQEYANMLNGDKVLEELARDLDEKSSTAAASDEDEHQPAATATVLDVIRHAFTVAVQKTMLYHCAPPSSSAYEGSMLSMDIGGGIGGGNMTMSPRRSSDSGPGYIAKYKRQFSTGSSFGASVSLSSDSYCISLENAVFSFAHDRLQQAAAQCVSSPQEEAEIHYFLGKQRLSQVKNFENKQRHSNKKSSVLENSMIEDPLWDGENDKVDAIVSFNSGAIADLSILHDQQVYQQHQDQEAFEILFHFSKSKEFVAGDQLLILQLSQLAAKASSYYVTAGSHEQFDSMLAFILEMLDTVIVNHDAGKKCGNEEKIEEQANLQEQFQSLQVQILVTHHQIKFLMNDLQAADRIFETVRPRVTTPKDIRDAYFSRISLCINKDMHPEATAAVGEALAKLHEESVPADLVLPEGQPAQVVMQVTQEIKNLFKSNPGWTAEQVANSLPVSTDEDHNFRVEIMISIVASLYLQGRYDLYLYIPAVACLKILNNGLTRSSGHAFAVLGFALVAMFGDPFGAEIAMISCHLVERFDNPVCVCRALVLSGMSVLYDKRYEHLAAQQLYKSYVSGRNAHDILWACYGVYILSQLMVFEGTPLPEVVDTLNDMFAYAVSDGHQILTERGTGIVLHMAEVLMTGKSDLAGPVYHFNIPDDDISKVVSLIPFFHGSISMVTLYHDDKITIAWQLLKEVDEKGWEQAAIGMPLLKAYHLYAVLICHGMMLRRVVTCDTNDDKLSNTTSQIDNKEVIGLEGTIPVTAEDMEKLKDIMQKSFNFLKERNDMAPVFTAHAHLARGCVFDVLEDRPWDAMKEFEKAATFVTTQRQGKHLDLLAIAKLLSSDIFRRQELPSMQISCLEKAIFYLKQWGADHAVERLSKVMKGLAVEVEGPAAADSSDESYAVPSGDASRVDSVSVSTPFGSGTYGGSSGHMASAANKKLNTPDFAAILSTASYISSFSSFDELVGKLSSALLKQAAATRLVLLVRHAETGVMEPTAEFSLDGLSSKDKLPTLQYSSSIVKITDCLKESVVIHSAKQESPYCFEKYIQESKVQSIASMPITHQDNVIAVVYLEHDISQGAFSSDIMSTMALLAQNVASAIVNARLLRDLRKRTAQLEQSHVFLAKALRVKETILSNTSHELRSPLNGIIGLNEYILESHIQLDPEVQNCVKTTLAMGRQLLGLVTDILDLSRIEEGAYQLHYELTEVRTLVEEVFEVAKYTTGNNTSLINKVDSSIEIMADPGRIKQVIVNLTSNAIKFTPEGSVTVSGEFLDEGKTFMISVIDTGIGIDRDHLDVVFEPFFQATSYETRRHGGAGLGLSITKKLVELHGGRIDVSSNVGVGTSFHVYIPTTPPLTLANPDDPTTDEKSIPLVEAEESLDTALFKLDRTDIRPDVGRKPVESFEVKQAKTCSTNEDELIAENNPSTAQVAIDVPSGGGPDIPEKEANEEPKPLFNIPSSEKVDIPKAAPKSLFDIPETGKGDDQISPSEKVDAPKSLFKIPTPDKHKVPQKSLFDIQPKQSTGSKSLFDIPASDKMESVVTETKIPEMTKPDAAAGNDGFLDLSCRSQSAVTSNGGFLDISYRSQPAATENEGFLDISYRSQHSKDAAEVIIHEGSLLSPGALDEEPLRVLAVDDTPINLKVLSNFLRKANMIVDTAVNGQQLLDKTVRDQWSNYDIILLDWMMPVMDGITACRLLRQRIPSDLLPVIFLTAKTDPGAVQKGFEAGGTDFATKPLNRHEVIARATCQGLASRRARARYFESIPIAESILTKEPFWKMLPATGQRNMFVICFSAGCASGDYGSGLNGALLLEHFQKEKTTFESEWRFCELRQDSVSFLACKTTESEIKSFLRLILNSWAEAQLSPSTVPMSKPPNESKPLLSIGIDFRAVRAYLFGGRQPHLATVEACSGHAQYLAGQATQHEQILFSDSAKSALSKS